MYIYSYFLKGNKQKSYIQNIDTLYVWLFSVLYIMFKYR